MSDEVSTNTLQVAWYEDACLLMEPVLYPNRTVIWRYEVQYKGNPIATAGFGGYERCLREGIEAFEDAVKDWYQSPEEVEDTADERCESCHWEYNRGEGGFSLCDIMGQRCINDISVTCGNYSPEE